MTTLAELTGNVSWDIVTLVIGVMGATAAGTWWLSRLLKGIKSAIVAVDTTLHEKIEASRTALEKRISDLAVHIQDSRVAQAWAAASANPGFKVPDPRDPTKVFIVMHEQRQIRPAPAPAPVVSGDDDRN